MEAIILAGGKGTRLQNVIKDTPKPMAMINGFPFLSYVLKWLENNEISGVVISVGYQSNILKDYYGKAFNDIEIEYCQEDTPLGTGGAIAKALKQCKGNNVLVLNGDTLFDIDLAALKTHHRLNNADITLALKNIKNENRYGTVQVTDGIVTAFNEKTITTTGFINGGIYYLSSSLFYKFDMPESFSFEKDFLMTNLTQIRVCALPFEMNFIDIGIPEDYEKAQSLVPQWVSL